MLVYASASIYSYWHLSSATNKFAGSERSVSEELRKFVRTCFLIIDRLTLFKISTLNLSSSTPFGFNVCL